MDTLYFKDFFSSISFVSDDKPPIVDAENEPIHEITGLGKINILIGANDSGKSYILRQLVKNPDVPCHVTEDVRNKNILELKSVRNSIVDFFKSLANNDNIISDGCVIQLWQGGQGKEVKVIVLLDLLLQKNKEVDILIDRSGLLDETKNRLRTATSFEFSWRIDEDRKPSTESLKLDNSTNDNWVNQIRELIDKAIDLCNNFIWKRDYYYIYFYHLRSLHRQYLEQKEKSLLHDCFYSNGFATTYQKDTLDKFRLRNVNNDTGKINEFLQGYFKGLSIETGQDMFDTLVSLCYGAENSYKLESFEKFLSTEFFQGKKVRIRPKRTEQGVDSEIEFHIEGSSARTINELGTGIQMMIAMTLPLLERGAGIVFIEEPEMYIHPGLQRQLMHIYAQHELFQNYQFFMTTHSNHIIDASNYHKDISLFSVKKQIATRSDNTKEEVILLEQKKRGDMQLLDMLGVGNSANFLANCTIWVEGPTDRYYIRKFFELYQKENSDKEDFKEFKEGLHYAFIEYGGALIANLDFDTNPTDEDKEQAMEDIFSKLKTKNITNRCFLLADRDNKKADGTLEKQASHDKRNQLLSDNYYYSPNCNEIENHLSWKVIKKTVDQILEKDNNVASLPDDDTTYKDIKLGTYLDNILGSEKFAKKENKSSTLRSRGTKKPKTLADKKTFCELAIEHMKSYEDLSEDAILLCEKMYDFIKRSNENIV